MKEYYFCETMWDIYLQKNQEKLKRVDLKKHKEEMIEKANRARDLPNPLRDALREEE